MKLTSITLDGFKGIKDKATLPIAPITLLFGANSTGKSTILHGLLYLFEVLAHHNVDPEYSELTGKKLWLGGFRNLVFGKSLSHSITMGASLDFTDDNNPLDDYLTEAEHRLIEQSLQCYPESPVDRWSFQLTIAYSTQDDCPYIQQFDCFANGEHFCRFEKKSGSPSPEITYFSMIDNWSVPEEINDLNDFLITEQWQPLGLEKQPHALPDFNQRLNFSYAPIPWENISADHPVAIRTYCEASLSQATLAPLKQLSKRLKQILHIGPLRVIPDQHLRPD
ncbi:hypothetical protein CI610_02498 [invertebrate metagenome]|uniref:Endonuclease GajA/Old nuclease/RecF-like AAA domain-containing protein n=1 Tax=invertebrate metagenome TaxID=1711999 RepID=A0A2H9T5S9_9ZZZZ